MTRTASTHRPLHAPAVPAHEDERLDEHELAGYVPSGNAADQQAAAWLLRRHAGLDATAQAAFQAWLAADPAHPAALARHQSVWAELDSLPGEGIDRLKATLPRRDKAPADRRGDAARSCQPLRQRPVNQPRRAWLGGIGRLMPHAAMATLAFAVAGGGWMGYEHWQRQPTFTKTYATARGQLLDVTLPDGSELYLDTATRAVVTLYRHRREVRLSEGQTLFAVHADAARPFDVLAGPLRVTVLGTRFSVRHTARDQQKGVRVAVEAGRVQVAMAMAKAPAGRNALPPDAGAGIVLTAGQAVASDAEGRLGETLPVAAASIAPWRDGRVAFDNITLSQALAEFERYGDTRLRLSDPAVGELRLSGSFDVRKADNFAHALARILPVQLRHAGDVTEIALAR